MNDDPYKILAINLMANCSEKELYRLYHDKKAIKRRITREVGEADFYGDFIDCISVALTRSGEYRNVRKTLQATSDFFYSHLDVQRFRDELLHYCQKYGKHIE